MQILCRIFFMHKRILQQQPISFIGRAVDRQPHQVNDQLGLMHQQPAKPMNRD